jgi:tetratricopeptide (TPR) repeat protein
VSASLQRWKGAALAAAVVIVLSVPLYLAAEAWRRSGTPQPEESAATFVGRDRCKACHEAAYEKWSGSHHDRAMAEANEETVRGDFDDAVFEHGGVTTRFYRRDGRFLVSTEGADGVFGEFEVLYTFGYEPLQQYLVPFPGGRLQALSVAWDTERERWFHLYPDREIPPDDWLHWTRGGQNWNGMCAECHSTNLRKNFDAETKSYETTWSEIDVSCEACHGPGSRHVEWAEIEPMARPELGDLGLVIPTGGISSRQLVDLCAPCHSRRTELGDYNHTRLELLDNLLPALLREGLYHADGQILDEVYVYGSYGQSKMFHNDVRCSDCHDVHSLERLRPGNELCLQCHRADTYDSADHHFHKKVHEGKPSDGALCVKCHMPEQPYMVIDWRADHSIRVPRPDLTLEIGTPNACSQSGCHDDKPDQWSADAYLKWYGLARKPHYGTVLAAGRAGDDGAAEQLVRLADDVLYPAMVRATALSLLERYPGEEATGALRRALADDEALVRHTAIGSLTVQDPGELVSLVAPLLFDPVRAVRMQAAVQLSRVPPDLLKPYQREAYEEARREYREAMEYSLDFSFAGMNLGNLYLNLGQPDLAETYYRTALEVDDLFYPAKMNLALLLNQQGRNDEAERLLREVLDAYPERADAAYSLALLLVEVDRADEAVPFLVAASDGMPQNSRVHYNLGLLLQQTGRAPEAEAAMLRALDLEPTNLDYLYALADHYLKRNRLVEAGEIADRMTASHPDSPLGPEIRSLVDRLRRD